MERAEPLEIRATPYKMHVIADDINDIGGLLDSLSCGFVDQFLRLLKMQADDESFHLWKAAWAREEVSIHSRKGQAH